MSETPWSAMQVAPDDTPPLGWDEAFQGLDASALSSQERLDFLNRRYNEVTADRDWGSLLTGGQEAQLTWQAAIDAFTQGNWVAALLCCQATCERTIAGIISITELNADFPRPWERMGMGQLLGYAKERELLPADLLEELLLLCDRRKPYGHWKPLSDPSTPSRRIQDQLGSATVPVEDLWRGLLVQDATHAMTTTLDLYYGNYGFSSARMS